MKKTTLTLATALIAVSLLASGAYASYEDDESAISEIRELGLAAFQSDYSDEEIQAYRELQNRIDLDNARFQWDTQITSATNVDCSASNAALMKDIDATLAHLSAE